jgi:hypothetical protein
MKLATRIEKTIQALGEIAFDADDALLADQAQYLTNTLVDIWRRSARDLARLANDSRFEPISGLIQEVAKVKIAAAKSRERALFTLGARAALKC